MNNTPSVRLLASLGFRQTGTEKVSFCKDVEGNDITFEGGNYELPLRVYAEKILRLNLESDQR